MNSLLRDRGVFFFLSEEQGPVHVRIISGSVYNNK